MTLKELQQIKNNLIELSSKNKLPSNMNDLSLELLGKGIIFSKEEEENIDIWLLDDIINYANEIFNFKLTYEDAKKVAIVIANKFKKPTITGKIITMCVAEVFGDKIKEKNCEAR